MIDTREFQQIVNDLEKGGAQKKTALQGLRKCDEKELAAAPADVCKSIVQALRSELKYELKQQSNVKDAVAVLGSLGRYAKPAISQLIGLLEDGVPDSVREVSVTALGKIGAEAKAAVEPLLKLLPNARPSLTMVVVRALGNIGHVDERVRAELAAVWHSPEQPPNVKANVAVVLCKLRIDAPRLLETITAALVANQEVGPRMAAAEALQWCTKNGKDVVPALLTASVGDTNEDVRQAAQAGLARIGVSQEQAILLCANQLGNSTMAETALRKSGLPAVRALISALGNSSPETRVKAARTIGVLGEQAVEADAALTDTLGDKDPSVRLAAAKSLWNVSKKTAVVPVLIELLRRKPTSKADEDSEARRQYLQSIMESLGRIGPPAAGATAALTTLTKDSNRIIRECAATALQKITSPAPPVVAARR